MLQLSGLSLLFVQEFNSTKLSIVQLAKYAKKLENFEKVDSDLLKLFGRTKQIHTRSIH